MAGISREDSMTPAHSIGVKRDDLATLFLSVVHGALGSYGSTMAVADLCTSLGFVLD